MEVGLGVVFVPRSYRNYAKTLVSSLSGETHLTLSISCFLFCNIIATIFVSTYMLLLKFFCRLSSWCNVQLFIYIRFFMETWRLYRQYLEEARRNRLRRRRLKVKNVPASQSTSTPLPSQPNKTEWIVAEHNFAEPTSGGLVATFMELLYSKSVSLLL